MSLKLDNFKIKVKFRPELKMPIDLKVVAYEYFYDEKQEYFHIYTRLYADADIVKHYAIPMYDISELSIEPIYEDNGEKIPSC